jgi:hypothetical protein
MRKFELEFAEYSCIKSKMSNLNYEDQFMEDLKVKEEARRFVEELSDDATWDDLMYKIYVRQAIEAGLQDRESGRTMDIKEVRAKFGLTD